MIRLAAGCLVGDPEAWERCTLFDVNFVPEGMTAEELRQGLVSLVRRLYGREFTEYRRDRFYAMAGTER